MRVRRINWVGVRNFLIIAAIAGIVLLWQEGFGALAVSAERIILVLFVAALALVIVWVVRESRRFR